MALSADKRGIKRVCPDCGVHYYDLNKRPVACPDCSFEFTFETKTKGRKSKIIANDAPVKKAKKEAKKEVKAKDESEIENDIDGDAVVSLEDVKKAEEGADEEEIVEIADIEAGLDGIDDVDGEDLDAEDIDLAIDKEKE